MILDYVYFGDVVCFHTTYRTNKNFAPFVGFNHHRESVLFGAALQHCFMMKLLHHLSDCSRLFVRQCVEKSQRQFSQIKMLPWQKRFQRFFLKHIIVYACGIYFRMHLRMLIMPLRDQILLLMI